MEASVGCDWCGRSRTIEMKWTSEDILLNQTKAWDSKHLPGDSVRGAFVCTTCQKLSPFELTEGTITFGPGKNLITQLAGKAPDTVVERYSEAGRCWYGLAYRAAAVMARASVEEALKVKGVAKGKLEDSIDAALTAGILGATEHSIAHGSRLIGNAAVHKAVSIQPGEVPSVLSAAATIINRLFP